MVFSSIPTYLDTSNWQQQQQNHLILHHHHQNGSSGLNSMLTPPPMPPHGGSGSSIRPGSMAERARMANIPVPDMALKCPRCDSTNTKFCYFNNYSLTQPRHFCKTCRRYWTRGGALRNIPVGGGCRRNSKRSKSTAQSKSPATSTAIELGTSSTATSSGLPLQFPPGIQSNLPNYHQQLMAPDLGYGDMVSPLGFQQGQHLSLFGSGGFMFPLDHQGSGADEAFGVKEMSSFGVLQQDPVKMEENQEMNLSRRFLGMLGNNNNGDQCSNWNSNASSSSSSAWANNLSAGF